MRQARVLVRLNLETRSHHAAVDRPWFELVANNRSPTEHDYTHALVRAYGFDAAVEAALAYTPSFESLVDTRGRYRAGLIALDLLSLGLGPGQIATLPQRMMEPFAGVADALGWLYVHERAALCHEPVRREILRNSRHLAHATSYLGAYAGFVGARFDELGRVLDHYARTRALEDRIVAAAQDAFRMLEHWLTGPAIAHSAKR